MVFGIFLASEKLETPRRPLLPACSFRFNRVLQSRVARQVIGAMTAVVGLLVVSIAISLVGALMRSAAGEVGEKGSF